MEYFENTVSGSCERLDELKRQAEEINRRIKELSAPKQIAPHVTVRPLSHPRNLKDEEPIFGYTGWVDQDVWSAFIKLAKTVHEGSPQFYMSTTCSGSSQPYIRQTGGGTPRTIDQLSIDQIKISAEMLDEMIAVYNRYFLMLHKQVIYDPRDGSGPQLYEVLSPGDGNEATYDQNKLESATQINAGGKEVAKSVLKYCAREARATGSRGTTYSE